MIKKLLTILAIGSIATITAQTAKSVGPNSFNATTGNNIISASKTASAGCIQVTTQTTNSITINTAAPCVTTSPFGGFVNGTNCYGDLEKANYFAPSTFSAVTGPTITNVAVGFYKTLGHGTSGTTGTVALNIYNGSMASGPTGAPLATKVATLAQIIAAQTGTNSAFLYTFTLTTPIVAPAAGFFCALTVPNAAGDTIVILNQSAAPANLGWEKQAPGPGTWVDMGTPAGWGTTYKANMAFYPNICGSNIISGISKNLGLSKNVTIMPNPSTGLVNVSIALAQTENITVTVTNALGQQIISNKYDGISNEIVSLDLTSQSNGVYFVTVSNGKDKMVQRLILNK
ncbi:MAG: T9SS type A sorting domain-containing protein [Bacteroidetes bacterium]|nr:T9SS type A sorting domain-containing protein [Bacteroidota bacterium]